MSTILILVEEYLRATTGREPPKFDDHPVFVLRLSLTSIDRFHGGAILFFH
jgi:hypothetical protein